MSVNSYGGTPYQFTDDIVSMFSSTSYFSPKASLNHICPWSYWNQTEAEDWITKMTVSHLLSPLTATNLILKLSLFKPNWGRYWVTDDGFSCELKERPAAMTQSQGLVSPLPAFLSRHSSQNHLLTHSHPGLVVPRVLTNNFESVKTVFVFCDRSPPE